MIQTSLASHTLRSAEEGSGHALSCCHSRNFNQMHSLRTSHPLSCSSIYVVFSRCQYLIIYHNDNCVPRQQLNSCSVTRPFLCAAKGVACKTRFRLLFAEWVNSALNYLYHFGCNVLKLMLHVCCVNFRTTYSC